ncbi:MAG TPA: sigma-54 dependent transcriptional regulator [Myxococcota bacterium]|jgi:two-component system response regulator PilR (NtrC family)
MSRTPRVLVVDDERGMRDFLEIFFRREGMDVATAANVAEARALLDADDFDLLMTDVQMPGASGIELLRSVKASAPETVVIVITAFATAETAIEAMKEGAYDYLTKPFKVDEVRLVVNKALEKKLLTVENKRLRSELRTQARQRVLIGTSAAMQRLYDLMAQVAATRTSVLVCGESGTGKELVARGIHDLSERREKPFVAVNCGAIPENLLESELFGHVKGSFTGAVTNKPGLFEVAHGGTLFLDEIGDLPQTLQVKLLRALQEKQVRRVGGNTDTAVDVRIITATNRDLHAEASAGRFREDLYYRLNVIQLALPPLRERMEDVPLLAQHFLEKFARELSRPACRLADGALQRILAYEFPGNVRELENTIERAVALCRGDVIEAELLPAALLAPRSASAAASRLPAPGETLDDLMNAFERELLLAALAKTGGVKKRAAQLLGITFRSFRYRLEKLGLDDGADPE